MSVPASIASGGKARSRTGRNFLPRTSVIDTKCRSLPQTLVKIIDTGGGTVEVRPNTRANSNISGPEATLMEFIYTGCGTLALIAGNKTIAEVDVCGGAFEVLGTDDGMELFFASKSIAQIVDGDDGLTIKVIAAGVVTTIRLPITSAELARLADEKARLAAETAKLHVLINKRQAQLVQLAKLEHEASGRKICTTGH